MPGDVLHADELAAALADPEWCEAPVTDAISPLTLVELTQPLAITPPAALPRVLVGVAASGVVAAAGLDLLVAGDEIDGIAHACAATPQAATTLVQLLRVTETLPVAAAVAAESFAYSTLLGGAGVRVLAAPRNPPAHRPGHDPAVVVSDVDGTITVTLHRPEVRNVYDAVIRDTLVDVLRSLGRLDDPPAIVLRGDGTAFCSGGDLSEFGRNDDLARGTSSARRGRRDRCCTRSRQRITARVHGACVGAGVELPAFCGRVEAAADATFRLPEVEMGLIPGAGGTVSLPRRIGRQRTAWLALSGESIDVVRAHEWRLVDTVVDGRATATRA